MARDDNKPDDGSGRQAGERADAVSPPDDLAEMTLLSLIDPDPVKAAVGYQAIHQKLISYFSNWRSPDPENLAAETISRADQAIKEGKQLVGKDAVGKFVFSIAKYIRLEDFRKREIEVKLMSSLQTTSSWVFQPDNLHAECLNRCLQKLPPKDRALIIVYEELDARQREELADSLGIAYSTLRAKIARIRAELRGCANDC